ncbi:HD domain-containing protein [Dethiosulfatibacter aminovorans DSM 17477]|uniref:HD domain-containing protein n=1 Tax=Dethiosulfatibacter aminovorans DSM 17477 TaxID=1121476 RepID=A0A1M6GQB3_9FIRM|nr:HD domain-containing protein [Dethiosulfatibacter aminovorans]SHJ12164.1 HD domain-containing protein [Dethiosulfatibacter aminovorans DSM 17477]
MDCKYMDAVDRILNDKMYRECLGRICEIEKDRKFCRHNMAHFLDASRIAYIMSLEDGAVIEKNLIYATGLLHDIGRHEQYLRGVPHEVASAEIAAGILMDAGYTDEETVYITKAILDHRNPEVKDEKSLSGYIYRADKKSRACFNCASTDECNWSEDKKNMKIIL